MICLGSSILPGPTSPQACAPDAGTQQFNTVRRKAIDIPLRHGFVPHALVHGRRQRNGCRRGEADSGEQV